MSLKSVDCEQFNLRSNHRERMLSVGTIAYYGESFLTGGLAVTFLLLSDFPAIIKGHHYVSCHSRQSVTQREAESGFRLGGRNDIFQLPVFATY